MVGRGGEGGGLWGEKGGAMGKGDGIQWLMRCIQTEGHTKLKAVAVATDVSPPGESLSSSHFSLEVVGIGRAERGGTMGYSS